MSGLNRYEGKDKRRQRLRNHIAKDLRSPKYNQRVVEDKRSRTPWADEALDRYFEDE